MASFLIGSARTICLVHSCIVHGDMSVREVIDRLHLDYGTVSPLLKRLESRGLVERRRRAEDERSVVVSLTEAGRALREKAHHVPATIGAAFGLPEEGMAALRALLSTVTASATSQAVRSGAAPAGTGG